MHEIREHWLAVVIFLIIAAGATYFVLESFSQSQIPGQETNCNLDGENVMWEVLYTGNCD